MQLPLHASSQGMGHVLVGQEIPKSTSIKSKRPPTTEWQHGCKHLFLHAGGEASVAYILHAHVMQHVRENFLNSFE